MPTTKVFDFTSEDVEDAAPLPFTIKYMQRDPKTEKWAKSEVDFTARGEVPAGVVVRTIAAFADNPSVGADGIQRFFADALVEKDRQRFLKWTESPDTRIDMDQLSNIMKWLMGIYESQDSNESSNGNGNGTVANRAARRHPTRRV